MPGRRATCSASARPKLPPDPSFEPVSGSTGPVPLFGRHLVAGVAVYDERHRRGTTRYPTGWTPTWCRRASRWRCAGAAAAVAARAYGRTTLRRRSVKAPTYGVASTQTMVADGDRYDSWVEARHDLVASRTAHRQVVGAYEAGMA